MAKRLRPIGHEDRLSVVDHLDELRHGLIVCAAVLVVAFGFCFWQKHRTLHLLNRPLPPVRTTNISPTRSAAWPTTTSRPASTWSAIGGLTKSRRRRTGRSAQARALRRAPAPRPPAPASRAARRQPSADHDRRRRAVHGLADRRVLRGAADLVAAALYELYAFVIPAIRPEEKRVARRSCTWRPVLFLVGRVFTYIVVLPAAVKFLQGYNSNPIPEPRPGKAAVHVRGDDDGGDRAGVRDAADPARAARRRA